MENTNRIWLLGAADPEMEAIEALLRECGERVEYAEIDGRRVHPGNAYRAEAPALPEGVTGYAVECVDVLPEGWVRIDHHRPGDPGYGRPPEEYWVASSLGQAFRLMLGNAIPKAELRLTSAADHCLAAAYQGECPGVRPDTLMEWRAEVRAKFQRRSKAEVLADIEAARDALRLAKKTELAPWIFVADLRGKQIPELPEAAAREGRCFLSTVRDRDGRAKVGCMGGTPDQIRAFMESWAPEQGLTDIYGDPARGFAGGYLPAEEK